MYVNLLIVFLLSGLWHGAGWNYIVWGAMHGVLYVLTRLYQKNLRPYLTQKASGAILHKIMTIVSQILLFLYVSAAGVYWYVIKVLRLDNMAYSRYILMWVLFAAGIYLAMIGRNAAQRMERVKYRTWTTVVFSVLAVWCVLTFSKVSTFLYFNF